MDQQANPATGRALWIAVAYAVFGFAWIAFSDFLVEAWIADPAALTHWQTIKGWGFIAVTAFGLYYLLYRIFRADARLFARTHQQRAEIDALSRFRESVIESAHVWINSLDSKARITLWNRAAEEISGYSRDEVVGGNEVWTWLYPDPDYRADIARKVDQILEHGTEVSNFETRIRTRDGDTRIIAWDSRQLFDISGSVAIGYDVTTARAAEAALRERERQLSTLLSNLPGVAYRCRDDGQWTMEFVSSGCVDMTGYHPEEIVGNRVASFHAMTLPEDRERVAVETREQLALGRPFAVEYRIRRRDGRVIWISEQGQGVDEVDGCTMIEGIMLDITTRKRMEQDLQRLATRDALTGLINRGELDRRLRDEIERARRYDRPLSLLWLDLDEFKSVNDRFGHRVGDMLLREVSARLLAHLRSIDSIARYGGEELVIMLPEMRHPEACETAERLRALVADKAFALDDAGPVHLTLSIGVASFPGHGAGVDELYTAADHAMYRAKHAGRDRVCSVDDPGATELLPRTDRD